RIVLLGWSVSENSDVGNFILGRAAFDSEAPPDVVERVSGRLKDRRVIIINSPQLLQTNISDHQTTQTVRECVHLSDPGPHVIVLLLKHEPCSAEDQERVEKVLLSFSERVYQHTMVLSTREPTETNDILQKIIQKCANRHFSLQTSSSPHDLLQMFEDIEKMNDARHLDCAEASQYFTVEKPDTEKQGVKLNLVVCGSDDTLKSSISELILQQIDRRSDVDLHGRLINLVELPALIRLSEEEVMRQTLHCVSLCHPGVHVFLLVIPDAILNNEDKAEMEEIQRIFTSRINKHIMILIKQNSERQTAELNEETQSIIQSFGVRHNFIGPKNQVSTLMENIEQMLEENRGEFFSTEMFIEAQTEKLVKYEEMKKKILSLETHLLSQESEDELRIVLLGKTGVGKSATGNTILGRDAFTAEESFESVTKESQRQTSEINGRRVTVIDTPGLFDTELTNEEIQREIRHCISMILPGPHVFLLLIPLGRFTHEEEKSVKIIQETFGENSLMFTMVLFTRGDFLKKKTIDQCLGKPGSVIRNLIETCGNRFHVFDNNQTGDQTQVTDLLEKIDNMVKANGGSFYSCKMFRQMEREKQEQQMKILTDRVREREEEMKKLKEEKEKMKMMMEEERQNQDKERKRREEELKEQKEQMRDEMKQKCKEWEKQKQEEKTRREEDEKKREKEKQICDEEIQKLQSEMEGIIREKERIEGERREQLQDVEKRLIEERNMREDQQKTLKEKLKRSKRQTINNLFHKLNVEVRHLNKLRAADVLQITAHSSQSHESCAEEELIQTYTQKLLMMDYRARYIKTKETNEGDHRYHIHTDSSEDESDIIDEISLPNKETIKSDLIHPMDVQMAVFHCADGFLKQLMVTKLSQCQFALPLLVPDPFTRQIEFPLWTFRQINKSRKIRNTNNESIRQIQPIYKTQTPMVFFFRFGSVSSSKSQLMNSLINEKHDTFFHRNCPGSSRTRVLMDGVVEIAWFCPSGSDNDKFTECVAFCNLHGDAADHEKQLQIFTEMSSVNVVLLPRLDRNDRHAAKMQNLFQNKKPLISLFTQDESTVTETNKGKFKIGLKDRNQSDVSEELRRAINDFLSESSSTFRLEDVSKCSDIRVDEEDDDDCRRGRAAAQQMMSLLKKKDLTEIKESFLPHQGKLWHQWSQKNKELHRPRADEIEMEISRKQMEMKKIRQQQHKSDISEFMKLFIKEMNSNTGYNMFFLKWLRILLNEYISADMSALLYKYDEKWSTILKLRGNHDKPEQLKAEETELERISEDTEAANFGLEHIMREIGQIYESCSSVQKNKEDLQIDFSSLPSLAAEMMICGFPLELMDGDAAHVPVIWISAVLDQLIHKLGDQRVFVLSVLGIRGSGKSTMLNAMFGHQFAVSDGRTTRGAFMQLIRVSDEMKTQMNFNYILVVDTEGLHAPKLAGRSTRHHDNELATFFVGLGNLTLISIFGENPSEMLDILQIVVQAFMRMKKVRLNTSCVFVHQNISDVTAAEKNMERRRRLQETLDETTKLAAEEEVYDAECFSDVIRFDVQNDVKFIPQLWEGNPPMAPPNPNYCESIQELKTSMISHALKSDGMRLTHFRECIKDLWEAFLNEHFVFRQRSTMEISAYRKMETKYSKWSWSLHRAMMETENKLHNKIQNEAVHEIKKTVLQGELKETSQEVEKSISEFFEKDTNAEILIQWKTSFDTRIKELQENIVRETKRKLHEILQQRDLKKNIDAQRRCNENTLYEKSKELALKYKDKTNNEETLKKKFDLFWEQSVKKIKNIPAFKETDILNDVINILHTCTSIPVDSIKVSSTDCDIFSLPGYSRYVRFKSSKKTIKMVTRTIKAIKDTIGSDLSTEDREQISSLITDIAQDTDKMIRSYNIAKLGYNISWVQQLIDDIKKKVTEHEEGPVDYVFKNEFFMDLVLSIFKRSYKMITEQHRLFMEANDPVVYAQKKREEYYSIFQKYCHGATSAVIFGEIICQKLKEPIEQSVYKKTARDLTDEMRSNCESLNGNRSNLEKHILKTLAEQEDFDKYMNYIHKPRDHFKSFIRDEVSRFITDQFSVSVLPKMKENIELLQQKIMKAAHESTQHVEENRGDVGLWLKSFTQQISDELIFSEKDLTGIKHDDVDDFNLLEEVIRHELPAIMFDSSSRFNTKTIDEKLDQFRPDEILTEHLCQCCWVQCPFCGVVCTNTIENHDGDHSVAFHRVRGINGHLYSGTTNLSVSICTSEVASNGSFCPNDSDDKVLYRDYRRAGGVYAEWSISPDLSELPYWKWFVCRFQKDLEKHYNKTFAWSGKIPDEWRRCSKQDAVESLEDYH
ncbi:hypothetical protein M9458_007839, partial [Cirrhinus mrigala]